MTTITDTDAIETLCAEGFDRADVKAAMDSLINAGFILPQPDEGYILVAGEVDLLREQLRGEQVVQQILMWALPLTRQCGVGATTYAPDVVQIVLVDGNMPADQEYGDYRGYVIEAKGVWEANATDLDDAKRQAAALTGTDPADWRVRGNDSRGQYTWDHRA